jgi:hypothetical protein
MKILVLALFSFAFLLNLGCTDAPNNVSFANLEESTGTPLTPNRPYEGQDTSVNITINIPEKDADEIEGDGESGGDAQDTSDTGEELDAWNGEDTGESLDALDGEEKTDTSSVTDGGEDAEESADTGDADEIEDALDGATDGGETPPTAPLLSCCEMHEAPNCIDAICAAFVCGQDPFCCTTSWDALCLTQAEGNCSICGGDPIPKGSCCEIGATQGCTDPACEAQICEDDPYCCSTLWDTICADSATEKCSACGGTPGNTETVSCCEEHETPSCASSPCSDAVCAIDPYCCTGEWDNYCVACAASGSSFDGTPCTGVSDICACEAFVPTHEQLAAHWSPIWYHDVNTSNLEGDYFTAIDADGDLVSSNNWESLDDDNTDLKGAIYWSVVETETHWFILYTNFHPQDWNEICSVGPFLKYCHENDMEGAMVVVRKKESYGEFEVLYTEAHNHLFMYRNNPAITKKSGELEEAPVVFENDSHPLLYVEAGGHGVCALYHSEAVSFSSDYCSHDIAKGMTNCLEGGNDNCDHADYFPGGDGIVYRQKAYGEVPSGANDHDVGYRLLSFKDHVWPHRFHICNESCVFDQSFEYEGVTLAKAFDGDTWEDDKANPPWAWDSSDDGPVFQGDFFFRPAESLLIHVNLPEATSLNYLSNPYLDSLNL